MTQKGLPSFANSLVLISDLSEAVSALFEEAVDTDRGAVVALFRMDPRRDLLVERLVAHGDGIQRNDIAVAYDHLPAQVRKRVSGAAAFVDFGDQSTDFIKLLGLPPVDGGTLSMRGLALENELCGILALIEPKKRFGGRVLEKLIPASEMFALAYLRLLEHDARLEAVRTLEEITRSIHVEYERRVSELEERLLVAQDASLVGRGIDDKRTQLEGALNVALNESRLTTQKLAAVDEQVVAAVSRLERAHVEVHEQSEIARRHSELLHTLRQRLDDAAKSPDIQAAVEDMLRLLRNYE